MVNTTVSGTRSALHHEIDRWERFRVAEVFRHEQDIDPLGCRDLMLEHRVAVHQPHAASGARGGEQPQQLAAHALGGVDLESAGSRCQMRLGARSECEVQLARQACRAEVPASARRGGRS